MWTSDHSKSGHGKVLPHHLLKMFFSVFSAHFWSMSRAQRARPLHHSHSPVPLSRASEAPKECDTDTHDSLYGLMSAANTHSTPQWIRAIFHPTQLWRALRYLHSHWAANEYIWDPSWLLLSSLSRIYLSRCDKVEEFTSCLGVIPHPHPSDYMSLHDKMIKFSGTSYLFIPVWC